MPALRHVRLGWFLCPAVTVTFACTYTDQRLIERACGQVARTATFVGVDLDAEDDVGVSIEMSRVSEEWLVGADGDVHRALAMDPVPDDASIVLEPGSELVHALIAGADGSVPAVDGGALMPLGDDVPPVLALPPAEVQRVAGFLEGASFEELLGENKAAVDSAYGGDSTDVVPDLRCGLEELRSFYRAAACAGEWVIKVVF